MDNIVTPVTASVLLDNNVTQSLVEQDHPPGIITSVPQELGHTDLVDMLRNDLVPESSRLIVPLMSSTLLEASDKEKQSGRSLLSTNINTAYSLPSIMSMSSLTASSVDNNNVSINCSFTNSSVDSRDDENYGLHVTFDEDNRPQLRPKDGSQLSTGLEFLKVAEKSATVEMPCPVVDQIQNNLVPSSLPEIVSKTISNVASAPRMLPDVTYGVSSNVSNPVQASCPPRTLSCVMSEELHGHSSPLSPEVAETASSVSTAVNVLCEKLVSSVNPLPNGVMIEAKEGGGTDSSSGRNETLVQEVPTMLDHGLVSDERNPVTSHSNNIPTHSSTCSQAADSNVPSNKIDHSSTLPSQDGKSDSNSDPAGSETERCHPASVSSPTSAPVTPIRKSVRTHKNPLTNSEFVRLDISPRSRTKTAASKRLSLDNSTDATSTHRANAGTRATQSLPFTQPQRTKPRKELARTRKCGSSSVEGECVTGLKQKCLVPEQLPVKPDPKTTNRSNSSLPAEPTEFKRKRGRLRKNPAAVNGRTGAPLAANGSWSSLNSKAAGDSSLGSIGLVSELFSVTPFTPVSSHSSVPTTTDSLASKEVGRAADKSNSLPVPSKSQSPVTDLSFALDELSSFDQKHKKKRKKKKKKKKSRHSSLADIAEGDSKVVGNLDDLIAALQKVQMSSFDAGSQPSQPPEMSSSDGHCVMAKIFSQSFCSQNVAAVQRSFVVRGKMTNRTSSSSLPAVTGNRSKAGRKSSPLVGGMGDTRTRQSCLPPKKRHKLQMAHNVSHNTDVGKTQGIGRRRRGRPPKCRNNQHSQKPQVKTSKFCSKFFCLFVCIASFNVIVVNVPSVFSHC